MRGDVGPSAPRARVPQYGFRDAEESDELSIVIAAECSQVQRL